MMLNKILTDELTDMRIKARSENDYQLSDDIRTELDSRGSFCMDSIDGQVVYHMGDKWTRHRLISHIQFVNEMFKAKKIDNNGN